ncbi:MAG: hypothetical protein FJY29_07450 [Betaproteobacteria bacterium]|nr:hypothetical protein [Betaproteobacteria bacterium]
MNSLLHKIKLRKTAMACVAAASVLPTLAQSAPIAGAGSDAARGNSPTNEAATGTLTNAAAAQTINGSQVPPIPVADTGSAVTATTAAAGAAVPATTTAATLVQDAQKNTDPKASTSPAVTGAAAPTQVVPNTNINPDNNTQSAPTATTASGTTEAPQGVAPAQATDTTLLVPNGAALQTQLLPLSGTEGSPWSSYAAGAFLILGLAAAGVMLVRLRQGKTFGLNRSEKQMQLISTLALSPKRQILLIRIRDKEVAVAATEHGMTVLTEMPAQAKSLNQGTDDSGGEEPRRRKVQQRIAQDEPVKLVAAESGSLGEETAVARSEMLMGALKNLREKNQRGRNTTTSTETPVTNRSITTETTAAEKKVLETIADSRGKAESTLKQTRAAFPKYLANAFEQESKRNIAQGNSSANNSGGTDDASSVTNMIRERLKDLRPLA